jgi:FtsZ-binding cell division protein ZapB
MDMEDYEAVIARLESEINALKIEVEDLQEQNFELRCRVSNLEWRIEDLEK